MTSSAVGTISGSKATSRSTFAGSIAARSRRRRCRSMWARRRVAARDRLGEEAEHGRGQVGEDAGRQHLRPEHDHDVRGEGSQPARASRRRRRRRGTRRTRVRTRSDCSSSAQASKNVDWPTNASRSGAPSRGTGYGPAPPAGERVGAHRRAHARGGAGERLLLTRAECTLPRHGMAGAHHPRDPAVDPHRARAALRAGRAAGRAAASAWLDLGCGAGVAAAAALAGDGPARAVLVDASDDALARGGARGPRRRRAVPVVADLASEAGLAAVRAALGDARDGVRDLLRGDRAPRALHRRRRAARRAGRASAGSPSC